MIHPLAGLSPHSKKNTSGKTGNAACFWFWKNYLLELFRLCLKKGSLPVQNKKISLSKLENGKV